MSTKPEPLIYAGQEFNLVFRREGDRLVFSARRERDELFQFSIALSRHREFIAAIKEVARDS